MKIYLINYDMSKRADKTIYASQYSSFKAGIKVPGATDVKLFDGQTEISADASLFHGYKAFPLDAGDVGQKEYTIKADGSELKLKVVSTESTAVELNDKDTVFDLPAATADTLGGIKVGANLTIGADGTLSASGGSIPADLSVETIFAEKGITFASTDGGSMMGLELSHNPDDNSGKFLLNTNGSGNTTTKINIPRINYDAKTTGEIYFEIGSIQSGKGLELTGFQDEVDFSLAGDSIHGTIMGAS